MSPEDKKALEQMFKDVKHTLKPLSKNQLIKYCTSLLVDVYMLNAELQKRNSESGSESQKEANETVNSSSPA